MILCGNPGESYRAHREEIDAAVARVLASGTYIHGPECAAFEAEFAAWLGTREAVGVASGTDAVRLALTAAGIEPGDEVIAPSHTAVATVAAIELAGAAPVLVDIEPEHFTIDPAAVERAITPRTKAVVAVHLYGNPAAVDRIREIRAPKKIVLVEDCAQAHGTRLGGRRVGTIGDVAAFSFYPTKNLGALGDAGMVATNDAAIAERCRSLREYGWSDRHVSERAGMNSRLDEIQAAILRVKLRHLDALLAARRSLAKQYASELAGLPLTLPAERAGGEHAYHLYVVRTSRRDALKAALERSDIFAGIHYPVPVHLQPAYRDRVRISGALSQTERAAGEILSLPLYAELLPEDLSRMAGAVRSFFTSES